MLPQLRELEERFPDTLAVIGVHSPKFEAEHDFENVRQAVMRYEIQHPVVNDPDHMVWMSYAVSAWPTTVFINPDNRVMGQHSGELGADQFAELVAEIEAEFDKFGRLNREVMSYRLDADREPARYLKYPGKVLADAPNNRLFIADSGHHRILVADLDGVVNQVIGRGTRGLNDGDFDRATFSYPQGMAVSGDVLYVADTDNHAIRRIDLKSRRVERIAGTGVQARFSRREGEALSTDLSSPWDLALVDGEMYIAMAGNHTIWALNVGAGEMHRFAGTGREALSDGSLERCALAQPSGLAYMSDRLYVADSETSAVRVASPLSDMINTIVGEGLFDFGDKDGIGHNVRLQHCLGIDHHDGLLYVADTYNNKIKVIDPDDTTTRTFLGTGEAGMKNGPALESEFWEPSGLSISGGIIYIADTNNHVIRTADISTGAVSKLEVRGA